MYGHLPEGISPSLPWTAGGANGETVPMDRHLNLFPNLELLQQHLGDSNPARVTNPHHARLRGANHFHSPPPRCTGTFDGSNYTAVSPIPIVKQRVLHAPARGAPPGRH